MPALDAVRHAAGACRRCDLWRNATQTVFGEGPPDAAVMFVGEQPGDREDRAGKPFVGPAGAVLDQALAAAGIERARTYVTNAVKHFKNEPRGKRRLHRTPNAAEVQICRWWLDQELELVKARVVVALGATAFRALTGSRDALGAWRGRPHSFHGGRQLIVTVHPSYLLRLADAGHMARERQAFENDLRAVQALLAA